ncbi:MAG: RNA methyltransferase [Firmicutes bacterium]|nr:RNA methyltransferase [Bacillota bacterium]
MAFLTSRDNAFIKTVIALQTRKGRKKHQQFLAEGPHLLEEALKSSYEVKAVLTKGELKREGRIWEQIEAQRIPVYTVAPKLFNELTETENPQALLGVVAQPPEPSGFPPVEQDFLGLVLVQIQDPGNLGTILRTAWAAGFQHIFITPGTVDPYGGKVVRASQGGIFNLRIYPASLPELLSWAKEERIKLWAADPCGRLLYFQADYTGPTLFLFGNEAHGFALTGSLDQSTVKRVRIPLPGGADSLNVAISAGILLYEALRQRFPQEIPAGKLSDKGVE